MTSASKMIKGTILRMKYEHCLTKGAMFTRSLAQQGKEKWDFWAEKYCTQKLAHKDWKCFSCLIMELN